MTAFALRLPPVDRRRLGLAALAGLGWGVALTGGLAASEAMTCGVCLEALPGTLALSVAGGLATMGPLVLFGRRA